MANPSRRTKAAFMPASRVNADRSDGLHASGKGWYRRTGYNEFHRCHVRKMQLWWSYKITPIICLLLWLANSSASGGCLGG